MHARMDTGNANGNGLRMTEETALERRRRLARERVLQNISGWLREKAFVAVCTSNH